VIGQIETGHSIEIIGTLKIAEGQRASQIGRHGHGVEALHGEGYRLDEAGGEEEEGRGGGREGKGRKRNKRSSDKNTRVKNKGKES
jgi:hypothetical protein